MARITAREGYTLLELIVVLGIIAVAVGLLLSAIQHARANARAVGCLNNARQIGVASITFHDIHGRLPTEPLVCRQSPGWAIDLLPHLEQPSLWSQFELDEPVDADTNAVTASTRRPPIYCCPETQDPSIAVATLSGAQVLVRANHYTFNGSLLGIPLGRVAQTDTTMLGRDSGSFSQVWHSSPFVSVLSDGSAAVHSGGTVVLFASGRTDLRFDATGIVVQP